MFTLLMTAFRPVALLENIWRVTRASEVERHLFVDRVILVTTAPAEISLSKLPAQQGTTRSSALLRAQNAQRDSTARPAYIPDLVPLANTQRLASLVAPGSLMATTQLPAF